MASRPASSTALADAFDLLESHKATPTAAAKVRALPCHAEAGVRSCSLLATLPLKAQICAM